MIAVLDADFHSLPSIQHRQQHGPVCILYFVISNFVIFEQSFEICSSWHGLLNLHLLVFISVDLQNPYIFKAIGLASGIVWTLKSALVDTWHLNWSIPAVLISQLFCCFYFRKIWGQLKFSFLWLFEWLYIGFSVMWQGLAHQLGNIA